MTIHPFTLELERNIEVNGKTKKFLEKNPKLRTQIEELGRAYNAINYIIPHDSTNYWSGHFFPCSESWTELQASFNLICIGFHKQAFISLRSTLELGLLSVYFNINDEGHITIQDWYKSQEGRDANTPNTKKIIADKGYDSDDIRIHVWARGATAIIPRRKKRSAGLVRFSKIYGSFFFKKK